MIEGIIDLTWRNPLFMGALIISLWFIPGIIVRRYSKNKEKNSKAKIQEEKISRLYPKKNLMKNFKN